MITFYDYLNIAFYFAFVVGTGFYFSRRSQNTSDYFRGGGVMPWWITGAGVWMAGFSAWSFTGAAGKAYHFGLYTLLIFYSNLAALIVLLLVTARLFRRLRVVTPFEAVRLRFGPGMQQFYTWVRLPLSVIFACMMLNAVGVFMSAVFGLNLTVMLVILGTLITLVSLLGGYAVAASDFVQMLLVVTVTITVTVLALLQPSIGGISGLITKAPASHFHWREFARPEFVVMWFLALTFNNLFSQSSLSDERATKYMMAKNDRHARLMLLIPIVGTLVTPLLWVIPPMTAAISHPDLSGVFPRLVRPEEGAFVLTAHDVLPQGMLGLLVCGIFAATLTHSSAFFNQGAGMLVRNFYLPVINPMCPERKLLTLSKISTVLFGLLVIGLAVVIGENRTKGLFDLLNQLGIALLLPLAIPACLGMFVRRTPTWSAWSTVLIGFVVSYMGTFVLTPGMFTWLTGLQGPFTPEEVTVFRNISTVVLGILVPVAWFLFSSLFYERSNAAHKESVDEFFRRLRTPLPDIKEDDENRTFPLAVGRFCLVYGLFVAACSLIPNTQRGRLCFLCCGGFMLLVGGALVRRYRQLS